MASIERTAYPRYFKRTKIKASELAFSYALTRDELFFINKTANTDTSRLNIAIQLKTFQKLRYFMEFTEIPKELIQYIKLSMGYRYNLGYGYNSTTTLYSHRQKIREYLEVKRWGWEFIENGTKVHPGMKTAIKFAYDTAGTMNNIPDIINAVIEYLLQIGFELPSFYRLNRMVRHTRHTVNNRIFLEITEKLKLSGDIEKLDSLLKNEPGKQRSYFNKLKETPRRPTIRNFSKFLEHYDWLEGFGDFSNCLKGVAKIKVDQFAEEAKTMNIDDLLDVSEYKRYTFIASLICKLQRDARDALGTMLCRLVAISHRQAISMLNKKLENCKEDVCDAAGLLLYIAKAAKIKENYCRFAQKVHSKIRSQGGYDKIIDKCSNVLISNSREHRMFLSQRLQKKRSLLLKLLKALKLNSPTQDSDIIAAIEFILSNHNRRSKYIDGDLDVKFASSFWKKRVCPNDKDKSQMNRRELETCVFEYAAKGLKSGDLFIKKANNYADYRKELMPWSECEKVLDSFCSEIGISNTSKNFVVSLKNMLTETGKNVDDNYFEVPDFVINEEEGVPVLKKYDPKPKNEHAEKIEQKIKERMPERSLLDILCNAHYYSGWADVFGPVSGTDSKLENPLETYVLLPFCYGTGMGPTQTTKHVRFNIEPKTLSRANRKHVNIKMLDKANVRINNVTNSLPLIKAWGEGLRGAGDGTFADIHDDNLISEQHFRYRQKGGIAYHHIADNYIAIFSTFIQCGVWEAIYIIDGLLKNASEIQPRIIHSDTQGQSLPVFGLTHLLGIDLMPRIRNWKDLNLYKPSKGTTYKNIDTLFCDKEIDWEFLEAHWQDLMQVAISIKYGRISSSFVLSKLNSYNYQNKLYRAFQELGKVLRTVFLLKYIADKNLRQIITATTNKAESYNGLSDWIRFGSRYITATNNPDEMEKAIKYNSLIANAIILQNVIDITNICNELKKEGWIITKEDISYISPYLTGGIKRFGEYILELNVTLPSLADFINEDIFKS